MTFPHNPDGSTAEKSIDEAEMREAIKPLFLLMYRLGLKAATVSRVDGQAHCSFVRDNDNTASGHDDH